MLEKQAPKRTYAIRVVEFQDRLLRDLLQFPQVANPRPAGPEILFEVEGQEDNAFEVLNQLVQHGYRVVEFRQTKANLEDIFMNVTEGHVQ